MATILTDPGIDRGGMAGASNIAQTLLGLGQQAQANRQAVGQQFFEQFKAEAESKGLSMSQLLDDPAYQQSVYGNLVGMTGDRKSADQMFARLQAGEPTPTQVMNQKFYNHMKQFEDMPLYDQTVTEEVSKVVQEKVKGESQAVTSETIAGIRDKINERNLWTPIAEAIGAEPESVDDDGIPTWGADFKKIQNAIAKHYTGKTWDEGKGTEGFREDLIMGLKNQPVSKTLTEDDLLSNMSDEQRAFVESFGGLPTVTPEGTTEETADRYADKSAVGYLKNTLDPVRAESSGDQAQLFVNQVDSTMSGNEPISFGTFAPDELKEVVKTETVEKVIPGYASTFEASADKLREQGGTEAQRSVVGDTAQRAADTDIAYKQALTLQAMKSLQGQGASDPRVKPLIDQNMKTYDFFVKETPQEMKDRLKSPDDVTDHNNKINSLVQNMKDLGIYVEVVPIPKDRWLKPDQQINTIGGMRLMGSGNGTGATPDDLLSQFN